METRYRVWLDGMPPPPQVTVLNVLEQPVYAPALTSQRPGGGSFYSGGQRSALQLTLSLWLRQRNPSLREQSLEALRRWALGRRLTLSTRPGCCLRVRCDQLPAHSALCWAETLTLRFTAWETPWWQSEQPTRLCLAGETAAEVLRLPGSAPTPVSAGFRAVDGGLNRLSLSVGETQLRFEGLSLAAGERLTVEQGDDGWQRLRLWRQNGAAEQAAAFRTADSDDAWQAIPGANQVLLAADAAVEARLWARGRWL